MIEIDFTREADYRKVVEGFKTLDDFGALHIVVSDGNVEDNWLKHCYADPEATDEEREFLVLLESLPYSMRYAAYLEA